MSCLLWPANYFDQEKDARPAEAIFDLMTKSLKTHAACCGLIGTQLGAITGGILSLVTWKYQCRWFRCMEVIRVRSSVKNAITTVGIKINAWWWSKVHFHQLTSANVWAFVHEHSIKTCRYSSPQVKKGMQFQTRAGSSSVKINFSASHDMLKTRISKMRIKLKMPCDAWFLQSQKEMIFL